MIKFSYKVIHITTYKWGWQIFTCILDEINTSLCNLHFQVMHGFCSGGRYKNCNNNHHSHGIYCCDIIWMDIINQCAFIVVFNLERKFLYAVSYCVIMCDWSIFLLQYWKVIWLCLINMFNLVKIILLYHKFKLFNVAKETICF